MKPARTAAALAAIVIVALVLCSSPTAGQAVFGTISGTVTDSTGAVVAGATVRVLNVNTGAVRTLTTNEAGIYTANSLTPGIYKVEAEASGFKTGVVSDIALVVNANPRIDIALQIGQKAETVSVTAEAPLLNTQQSSIGQTFNTSALANLPMLSSGDGRGVFDLVKLSAGISTQPGEGGYDGDNMRINGGRPRNDDYLLDGTSIQQPVWGGLAVSPSIDSIQEFRAETNNLSAEYGKVGGGVITLLTKNGTNAFHGSAYEFLRNDALNAKDWFLAPGAKKLPVRWNEFGATFGGPVIKNKLFFFVDYQGVRSSTSTFNYLAYQVPSAAFRSGDLSALSTPIIDPTTGLPFTNNIIPQDRISPASLKMMALWPDAETPSNCVLGVCNNSGTTSTRQNITRTNFRIDYALSSADHLFGVFHYQGGQQNNLGAFPNQTRVNAIFPAKALTLAWTHTFGTSMLNDVRFGWNKRSPSRVPYGFGQVGPSDFGLTGFPTCTLPGSNDKCGQPTIRTITGYSNVGGGGDMLFEPAGNWSITDTVSRQFGRHNLKFGGELRHYYINNIQPNRANGEFDFTGVTTGNGFADFLLGRASLFRADVQADYVSSSMMSHAYFVQDDWRLSPRLTLNLGLRYQLDRSWREKNHLVASFNPYTLEWEIPGVNAPEGNLDPDYKEFGPRVGFAWNPKGSFVVRGGYGIMYPGSIGHGRAGDGSPSPNILALTSANNVQWDNLPTIHTPDPSAPLTLAQAPGVSYVQRNQRQTYVQQWNFTLEQQLGRDSVVALSYIGSKGTRLPDNYYYNICRASIEQVRQFGWAAATMDSPYCAPGNGAIGNYGNNKIYADYHLVASSIYHAMTARVEKRYSNGFSMLGTFTWSKLLDDASSDWGGFGALDALPQDYYNRKAERSISQGDVPLILSIAPVYDLPFGRQKRWLREGPLSHVLGGWQISAIYQAQKGGPVGVFDYWWGGGTPLRTDQVRPMTTGNPLPSGFNQTLDHWFDTSVFDWTNTYFEDPATFNFGNSPRFMSNVRAPGLNNLNFSVAKNTKIPLGEAGSLQFRADFFNALNHAQFAPPGQQDDGNFGRITSTRVNMRVIQMSLHLYF